MNTPQEKSTIQRIDRALARQPLTQHLETLQARIMS
jgi:hypothetical protein